MEGVAGSYASCPLPRGGGAAGAVGAAVADAVGGRRVLISGIVLPRGGAGRGTKGWMGMVEARMGRREGGGGGPGRGWGKERGADVVLES